MLTDRKITAFTKKVADLADRPGGTITTAQLKAQFDSSPEELRVAHNGLVDDLTSLATGASGAHQIASESITGVSGDNVHAQLSDIKTQINEASVGAIPPGSIGPDKLSFTLQRHKLTNDNGLSIQVTTGDMNTLITDGMYTVYPGVLNTPTNENYHVQVMAHLNGSWIIQIAYCLFRDSFYVRRKNETDWLPWSQDLFTSVGNGKSDVTTAIIGKGGTVAGTSPHSFAELVVGINSIAPMAQGTGTLASQTSITISGLALTPTRIEFTSTRSGTTYYFHCFRKGVGGVPDRVRLEVVNVSGGDSASATLYGSARITVNGGSFTVTGIDNTHTSCEWAAWV